MKNYTIKTERLGLRNWIDDDINPFAKMCADERVMEFFPKMLNKDETITLINKLKEHFNNYGFCYFAVDRFDTNEFIGFIGLMHQDYETDFNPFVDIGWRLSPKSWGNGFATEGAKACLDIAFAELNLNEVFSVAPLLNEKSQRVMKKLGMEFNATFMHPKIEKNNILRECVAYKIKKQNFSLDTEINSAE